MRIGLAVADGYFGSGLSVLLDVLGTANVARALIDPSIPAFEPEILGPRRAVTASSGLRAPTTRSLADSAGLDVLVVPALGTTTEGDTFAALDTRHGRALVRVIASMAHQPIRLAGACTGVFALAEAGVLDGARATTSWWLGPTFRQRYPDVDLDLDAMVVHDERAITAGAAFAHIDLALALVRQVSPALADNVARLLVIDQRPAQSSYVALDHVRHNDPIVLAFENHARSHLDQPINITQAARAIGTSRRTLERRTVNALGFTPIALVQHLRVERATHLLRTTSDSLDRIAPQVGYTNASTLRTLLRRHR